MRRSNSWGLTHSTPDCGELIFASLGRSSGRALGRPARRRLGETHDRARTDVSSCGEPAGVSTAHPATHVLINIRTWKSPQPRQIRIEKDQWPLTRDAWWSWDAAIRVCTLHLGVHSEREGPPLSYASSVHRQLFQQTLAKANYFCFTDCLSVLWWRLSALSRLKLTLKLKILQES